MTRIISVLLGLVLAVPVTQAPTPAVAGTSAGRANVSAVDAASSPADRASPAARAQRATRNAQRTRAPLRSTSDGFRHVADDGTWVGDGRRRTYRIEVEPASGASLRWVTRRAEQVLSHQLAWTGAADWALRRVRRRPDIRIVIATPTTVDRLCAQAGLRTVGRLSCWNGRIAAINVKRWKHGSKGFVGSLRMYRRYVLNHEVGHALGHSHRSCPRRGARAPVMQQQTKATRPCRANGWPALDP